MGTDFNYRGKLRNGSCLRRGEVEDLASVERLLSRTKASRMRVGLVGVDNLSGGGEFTPGQLSGDVLEDGYGHYL